MRPERTRVDDLAIWAGVILAVVILAYLVAG